MKFWNILSVSFVSQLGTLVAASADGFPATGVNCADQLATNPDAPAATFNTQYLIDNYSDWVPLPVSKKRKGNYPGPFKFYSEASKTFTFSNGCRERAQDERETILEMPMVIRNGVPVKWSDPAAGLRNPGPWRQYFILKDGVVTHCGAAIHTSKTDPDTFAMCTDE
ncbi:hypothetical protein BT63DRAFT_461487 [Microthyrium microscopicum]|uniref:Uncharacterized protein n=1 Tax=Microthyrium microscopicum TaxID=703497 RepID=A0A6A6TTI3_9PEZI|nr:hypothetical protein BT63DRAFT_461487 [Microthyrium microscopicum]